MTDLAELAERCEKATAQYQRRLLSEAYRELFGGPDTIIINRWPGYISPRWDAFHKMLEAEAFLDAAMTLVDDRNWTAWELRSRSGLSRYVAEISRIGDDKEEEIVSGHACTAALALCAAALKARTASAGEAGTAATVKQGPVHEHATAESGDAQTPSPSSRERK